MSPQRAFPDRDHLSVLTALVIITYTLLRVIVLPSLRLDISIVGIFLEINIDTQFIMLVLSAMLTATGADWLIRTHPAYQPGIPTQKHLIIPGMAALGAGAILTGIPEGIILWLALPLSSLVLMAVLVAEYVAFDPADRRRERVVISLTGLTYILLLGILYTLQAAGLRAVYGVPISFLAVSAAAWRLLSLTNPRKLVFPYGIGIGICAAELVWAFHYWPFAPLESALFVSIAVYAGETLIDSVLKKQLNRSRWIELAVVTSIALAAVVFFT